MIVILSGGILGGSEVEWISDEIVDNLESMTQSNGNKYRLTKIGSNQAVLWWLAPGNEE
jgi:hypothetical protein